MKGHGRLLAFDILRIVSVWLIVASHVGLITNHYLKTRTYLGAPRQW